MELLKIPEPRAEENSESKGLCRFWNGCMY
jgi:hypothetical protein